MDMTSTSLEAVTLNSAMWMDICIVERVLSCDGRCFRNLRHFGRRKNIARVNYALTPNDHYSRRTATLPSKYCILYIYSTNIGTEYFKHGIHSPFFSLFKMQFVS